MEMRPESAGLGVSSCQEKTSISFSKMRLTRYSSERAARAAHRREDLALPGVRERVQARERADVVEVGDHVGVEDDLHGIPEKRKRRGGVQRKKELSHVVTSL